MRKLLTPEIIRKRLSTGWTFEDSEISRTYEFESYLAGVEFATDVARIADSADHHPRITIEYRSVTVDFTTHDADGVTERDLELAKRVESI